MGSRFWTGFMAAAIAVGASLPASAGTHPDAPGAGRAAAVVRLGRAAAMLTSGSIVDAVTATAGLGQLDLRERAVGPVELPVALAPSLQEPVGRLLAAVKAAGEIGRGSQRVDAESARAAMREVRAAVRAWDGDHRSPALHRLARLGEQHGGVADTRLLASAALLLAVTVEETLPALRAAAADLTAPAGAITGCEIADVPEVLCVGGTGANSFTSDYALLVDLGGDDTHANSAGGADPLVNGLAASVTIDVGGNDVYRSSHATAGVAQGGGLTGGIGMLVDAVGNDTYEIVTPAGEYEANGQGYGETGAGVLADLAGNDRYSLRNLSPDVQSANGQGLGGLGGIGIALDVAGDDTYAVESLPTPVTGADGSVNMGSAGAYGFGYGIIGGIGAFADAAGADSMFAHAAVGPLDPNDTRRQTTASASILAFGDGAVGGVGVAVGGRGDTLWRSLSENGSTGLATEAAGGAFAGGFGEGVIGGYGGLHDAGGNDVYRHEAVAQATRQLSIDAGCGCAQVHATAFAGLATLLGMGYGVIGGVGLIEDVGGDDRYIATASSIATAEARDDREAAPTGETPAATADARAADPDVIVQGSSAAAGAGYIIDHGGNDAYEARVTADARADASARDPTAATAAYALTAAADTFAQAVGALGGYGEIRDLDGADSYTAVSTSTAVANPPTQAIAGPATTSVQGSADLGGAAHFTDLDGGTADVFTALPADPACVGTRGQGAWVDCGLGVATGIAS